MRLSKMFLLLVISLVMGTTNLRAQSPRTALNFGEGWKFHLGDVSGAQFQSFDDSGWRSVDVPHDWGVEQSFSKENGASGQGYLPGGIGWYRKTFTIDPGWKGKRVKVLFDAIYQNGEVWINDHYLGKRPFGFISFSRDLTNYLNYGGDNVIAVRVDHSHDADSRWYTGSGMIRNVWLKAMEPVHVGQWGTFITTPEVGNSSAQVKVVTTVVNDTKQDQSVTVVNVASDSNKEVANARTTISVPAGMKREVLQVMDVENPERWSIERPYLYNMVTTLQSDGNVTDRYETPFGIRTFRFDAEKGFFLNGKSLLLKGVCLHNDAGALGSAVPKSEWRARLELMKEMGANAIRTSHNPPAPELLDLADEMGFVVMDEAFDEWQLGKKKWIHGRNVGQDLGAAGLKEYYSQHGYSDFFEKWAKKDIQDMVRRDRNHPSIILWSIGNEVDYPNDPYTDPYRDDYKEWRPKGYHVTEIARHLYDYVKEVDTTRPVTAAVANVPLANKTGYASVLDVAGYNYQEQYYEDDHKNFPDRKILGSENGDSYEAWKTVLDHDYIPGQFLWTGVDYLGEAGKYPNRSSGSGLVTLDDYRKPFFYYRKSLWTDKPMVYLSAVNPERERWYFVEHSWNWKGHEGEEIQVAAFTNTESVELQLNGRSLGSRKMTEAENHVLSWKVPYESGELLAIAKNGGEEVARYSLKTTGEPYKIQLEGRDTSIKADGKAITSIHVKVVDRDGLVVPNADNMIQFEVDGPGKNVGVGSADHNSVEPYKADHRKVYQGKARIFIKSTGEAGDITVKANSEGLSAAEVTIRAVE